MIIHICGMPGVGKLTITKQSKTLMSSRLIDNQLLVDLVESICDRDEDYIPFLNDITALSFSKLAARKKDTCIILTNALAAELPEDVERLENVRLLAASMERPFIPVLITCAQDENNKRLVAEDRSKKGKLRNPDVLGDILSKYAPAHYPQHPNALTLNNTNLDALTAAKLIADHCAKCSLSKEPEIRETPFKLNNPAIY